MEVCGTHTMAIARHALKQVLPENLRLISGPGCPVCVTHQRDLESALALARQKGVLLATYGDMLRVPGYASSLLEEKARGASVQVVTSAMEALELAISSPTQKTVFLGIGFETTAPGTAAALIRAQEEGVENLFLLSLHKRVPPVLRFLASQENLPLRGLLLPGHVATILGEKPFAFLAEEYSLASAIAGFEQEEILLALTALLRQITRQEFRLQNLYPQHVRPQGNPKARQLLEQVFRPASALWRGLGELEESGLALREAYASFDASPLIPPPEKSAEEDHRRQDLCRCGDILLGRLSPSECPLFGRGCTPLHPLGPCMVSGEGSCAAAWRYEKKNISIPRAASGTGSALISTSNSIHGSDRADTVHREGGSSS
jgi:hydrogenase expression/formation protein HypD